MNQSLQMGFFKLNLKDQQSSQSEKDIIKEFVDQSFERQRRRENDVVVAGSRDADEDGDDADEDAIDVDVIRGFVDESFERERRRKEMRKRSQDEKGRTGSDEVPDEVRDVIKEYVDQSFDRGNRATEAGAAALMSPKRELVECLRNIDLQVC